jgi:hypothetical protein
VNVQDEFWYWGEERRVRIWVRAGSLVKVNLGVWNWFGSGRRNEFI